MRPSTALFSLLIVATGAAAQAADEDPLKSAACGAAIASLESARAGGQPAEGLRSAALRACLGAAPPAGRTARPAQAPTQVPPPVISPSDPDRNRLALPPAPRLPPPPVAVERGPQPAQCDATGCWINDGTHLRHLAPGAVGPRGLCVPQAGLVYCP